MFPVFKKASDDLATGDLAKVGPALFEQFYDEATERAYKRWHARRLQGLPEHVVRESFPPVLSDAGQVGTGDASEAFCRNLKVPIYHLCRDSGQAERMQTWFSHPRSRADAWSRAGHWIMQDRSEDVNRAIIDWMIS